MMTSPALIEGSSLAYLTVRRLDAAKARLELGANGHGPDGPALADRLRGHILTWANDRDARPSLTAVSLAGLGHAGWKRSCRDLKPAPNQSRAATSSRQPHREDAG